MTTERRKCFQADWSGDAWCGEHNRAALWCLMERMDREDFVPQFMKALEELGTLRRALEERQALKQEIRAHDCREVVVLELERLAERWDVWAAIGRPDPEEFSGKTLSMVLRDRAARIRREGVK